MTKMVMMMLMVLRANDMMIFKMQFGTSFGVDVTPLPERQKKIGKNKGKKGRKESVAIKLSRKIDHLVDAVETHSSYSPTKCSDKSSEFATCVTKLDTIPKITRGDELY